MTWTFRNCYIWILLTLATKCSQAQQRQPNIVFIMADDMGWNDVSYHGSDQILTPNIDTLAYQGVVLQQYYSEPICTPTRSALLTGKYPERIGMQSTPLWNSEDRGIPLTEKLLPSYLKELGYSTHLVGKWHVGMSRNEYLPLRRGFDTHFGIRGGFVDYYTYNKVEEWPNGRIMNGLDMWDGEAPLEDKAEYLTDMLTTRAIQIIHQHNHSRPLFLNIAHGAPHAGNNGSPLSPPPPGGTLLNRHIAYTDRRLYADMVHNLDYNIGRVVKALSMSGMLDNTIIVFVSDNGAPTIGTYANWGINLPFRGIKQTPWEGGVRVPALVWHGSMLQSRQWPGLMHVTDWLPTLVSAAGGYAPKDIDGIDQWKPIIQNKRSRRNEVLVTLDDMGGFAAYRLGNYKLIIGDLNGTKTGYYGEQLMSLKSTPPPYLGTLINCEAARAFEMIGRPLNVNKVPSMRDSFVVRQVEHVRDAVLCVPSGGKGCLYNVATDPQEAHDLWSSEPRLAAAMITRLRAMWEERKPRLAVKLDARAEPAVRRYTWLPWLRDGSIDSSTILKKPTNIHATTFANISPYNSASPYNNLHNYQHSTVYNNPLTATTHYNNPLIANPYTTRDNFHNHMATPATYNNIPPLTTSVYNMQPVRNAIRYTTVDVPQFEERQYSESANITTSSSTTLDDVFSVPNSKDTSQSSNLENNESLQEDVLEEPTSASSDNVTVGVYGVRRI